MAVTDSEPFAFFYYVLSHSIFFLKKREMLYCDFVLLLLCYIVRSYIIVVLHVHGCACAGVRTRNKKKTRTLMFNARVVS